MTMYRLILYFLCFLSWHAQGQHPVDSMLASITNNNKAIIAMKKYQEAKKAALRTGLSPANPQFNYEYLLGNPVSGGNQIDFSLMQVMDYPAAYTRKRELALQKSTQSDFMYIAKRQDVLLEAKLLYLELTYRNILQRELLRRKENAEKWMGALQKKLDTGEGNILDLNKARLHLLELSTALQENSSLTNQFNQQLSTLNGGHHLQVVDTTYSGDWEIPNFETLIREAEARNPVQKYLEQEKAIGQTEVLLSKAMAMPKIEAGFRYQALLGQRFSGLHIGLSIPAWEFRNAIKAKEAAVIHYEANLQSHAHSHYFELKQTHTRLSDLNATLKEYRSVLSSLQNTELLNKALSLGQLTFIEYFMEMNYWYKALDGYHKIELEYHKTQAMLYKYRL